jgi:hypothetical protein
MQLLITAGLAVTLAACASEPAPRPGPAAAPAPASAAADDGIDGLTLRFFRCAAGAAFTVQNYENGRVRVTTSNNRAYDLRRSGDAFAGEGVTYARNGTSATLTGAEGGPYENCVQS